jgi:hypothetical protein
MTYHKYLTAVDGVQPETAENMREVLFDNTQSPQVPMPLKEVVPVPSTEH